MQVFADTHLHLYPCFDLDQAFTGLLDRLQLESSKDKNNASAIYAAFLAERADCNFYERLVKNYDQPKQSKPLLSQFTVVTANEQSLLLQEKSSERRLTLFPGRQIISKEKIEVLGLCTSASFPENLPAAELVEQVQAKGGVPVLPWSPGKWFFKRGQIIDDLLHRFTGQDLLIGDVSLRPMGWPLPLLMRKARRLGYTIISGSDPLPFAGEEQLFGRYGSKITSTEGATTAESIETLFRSLLNDRAVAKSFGQRSTPLQLIRRLRSNASARKGAMVPHQHQSKKG